MATVAKPEVRQKSAKNALLDSVDSVIDSAEKMTRREFRKATKEFKQILDCAASSHRRNRETA